MTHASYRIPVGAKRRDPGEIAALLQQGLARGMDLVAAFQFATASGGKGANRILEQQHRRATEQHRRTVVTYQRRIRRWQREQAAGAVVGAGSGAVGILSLVAVAGPGWAVAWFAAAGIGGLTSWRARQSLRRARPPIAPPPSVPPPPILPRSAIGAAEVSRFTQVRAQVASVATSIDRLHRGAGDELRRADAEAAGPLTALAERLLVLHRLREELPGTSAAEAAAKSAAVVKARLVEGTSTYDELLAAAARLLSAPDASRSTSQVLGPAIDAMVAYAHGLQHASATLRPESFD